MCDQAVTGGSRTKATGVEAYVSELLVLGAAVAVLVVGGFAATLMTRYTRRRTEREEELMARRVEEDFRRVFGDQLPAVDPYPRARPAAVDRPAKRSNWSGGKVRPQG
jgi:hypothetical protein